MNKTNPLLALILLLFCAVAQAAPFDIPANIRALAKAKHPYIAGVKAMADRKPDAYGNFGQLEAIMYVTTGEKSCLDEAVPKLLVKLTVEPLPSANTVRENFAELVMIYGWLKPSLTPAQNAEFEKRFHRWCEFSCAVGTPQYVGGFRYADSDQTTGQYLGLILCDQAFGWEWTKREDAVKAREAIRDYCAKAAGGEWIESGAYNLGTLQLLLMGCHAAGIENFPEVERLIPEIVEQQLAILTPDMKSAYQWGDEEEPGGLHLHRRISLFSMLIGLTKDARLQAALDAIMEGTTFAKQANLAWRATYFYQPLDSPKPIGPKYLRVSEGNGHFIYKRENAMLCVHMPRSLGVDHAVEYQSDIQLWCDGAWVLSRPKGYAGPAVRGEAGNSPLFAGLSSMNERGPIAWEETASGCEIVGSTSGERYAQPYYDPPPSFVESFTRRIMYEFPGKLTVADSFKGKKPERVNRYHKNDQPLMKDAPLWQQVWHCEKPTKTETGFTWKTPGGKTCTLTAPKGCKSLVIDEREKWGKATSNFKPSELKWQIRFVSDEPTIEMSTVFEVK